MSGLFRTKEPTGVWWRDHSLSLVLLTLLAAQTAYCLWSGHHVYAAEQLPVPFWIWWTFEYQVSLVADTFGVALIVILSKFLVERGSAESK